MDEITPQLLQEYKQGQETAFLAIVRRYKDPVTTYIYRAIGDYERAVDLAQETFYRVYARRDLYRLDGKLSTWIYAIATNLLRDEIRRRRREAREVGDEELAKIAGPDDASRRVEEREVRELVTRFIAALPEQYRLPLLLRDIHGLPYRRIAAILGRPSGTVKSRINRARLLLRRKLEPYWMSWR